ncbi:MAG: FemAB family protein [Microgenomates group bacterium GW2011_GWA1_48_10]|uniref:BioF2-like acetyltransferase domain-containing protein n=1 Tax=Candidatus Gottesmanbacteria bacterium RIFCSPHIGHO2_01_FULL_47_48 TaxID=1798381 RepID=A0A1F5ZZK6_9BACT|nr:MAG: FemAB family protein [Microgenomates group bacterium GW2011_GWA1_48_10]OGG17784.1 MAG: hypothetical protein A2721_02065 [Candidatus Gottesmanbacteria bacterium RIFCSPHIGHO2_01_FULL_47_48]
MIKEIADPEKVDSLANHITQSWEWGEFRKQTPSIKQILRLGSLEDGRLVKVWQIMFSKVPHLPSYTVAYLPRGPIPEAQELEEIKQFCRKEKAVFLKMEPFDFAPGKPDCDLPLGVQGKPILPRHTIYIDLTQSEEELLSQMHEKTRYNIRLAQKKGVLVREENSPEALESFIKLLEDTEKRQKFYSHTADYYRKLWGVLRPANMVYLLSANGPHVAHGSSGTNSPIAAIMLFRFKDFLYYPYGGSNHEFRHYMAPQLLHFEAMKLGKRLGCKTYDLWGSYKNSPTQDDPWWGFYRLKSGLGGKEVDFPETIDVPFSPLYQPLMAVDSLRWFLLKFLKRLK